MIANSRSRVATSSAEVASSRIRIRGFPQQRAHDAAGLAVRQRELLDGRAEVERRGRAARPSSLARAARASRAAETCVRQVSSAPSQTLSSTERVSATRTSWKTVTMPRSGASRGVRSGAIGRRRSRSRPASGACTPLRIFTSVLLPRAVLADQRVHLARAQLERAVAERLGRPERLRHVRSRSSVPSAVAGRSRGRPVAPLLGTRGTHRAGAPR